MLICSFASVALLLPRCAALFQIEGVFPDQQRLIFAGKLLADEHDLERCTIEHGHTVHLVCRLGGD